MCVACGCEASEAGRDQDGAAEADREIRTSVTTLEAGPGPAFVPVAAVSDLEEGTLRAFEVNGKRVAVARADGNLYAFADACTHRACSLADGELEGTTVTCPCHGGQFDVATGRVLAGPPREPIATYAVREQGGALQVELRA